MLPRTLAAAVLAAALVPAALAQEGGSVPPGGPPAPPPEKPAAPKAPEKPAKHENKISDAAKAAWAAMEKSIYSPVALGLKELKGKISMTPPGMDPSMGGSLDFQVAFEAPSKVTVEVATQDPMMAMQAQQMKPQIQQVLSLGAGIFMPGTEEYDADLEEKDGVKTLVVKIYEGEQRRGEMRLGLDAKGVPSKGNMKVTDPNSGMELEMGLEFQFAADGDKVRLEKHRLQHPMFGPVETTFTYVDAGGFKVLCGFETNIETMGMKMPARFTEMTVNGKKVELPAAKAPEKEPEVKPAPADPVPPLPPAPPKDDK